jgi:hypothetical protein
MLKKMTLVFLTIAPLKIFAGENIFLNLGPG